eukprot:5406950-Prymnesium_polylepis.1
MLAHPPLAERACGSGPRPHSPARCSVSRGCLHALPFVHEDFLRAPPMGMAPPSHTPHCAAHVSRLHFTPPAPALCGKRASLRGRGTRAWHALCVTAAWDPGRVVHASHTRTVPCSCAASL